MAQPSRQITELIYASAGYAAALPSYCEKYEHLEPTDTLNVTEVPEQLCRLGATILTEMGLNPFEEYVGKLQIVEEKNFYSIDPNAPKLAIEVDSSTVTWKGLQTLQRNHDTFYHPDVVGPGTRYHLNHTAHHLSKSVLHTAGSLNKDSWAEVAKRRITDMTIFAVKAAYILNLELPENRNFYPTSDL